MSRLIWIAIAILSVSACKIETTEQKAAAKKKESEVQAKLETAQNAADEAKKKAEETAKSAEKDKLEAEIKAHFNQAFSYIGSAKAATSNEQKEKLFLNAEKEFTNALAKNPNHVDALLNRGVLYIAMNKTNKAEEDLKKALGIDPKNSAIHYNLACLHSINNKLDLAVDSLDSALKNGFNDYDRLRNDPDLKNLRANKEFQKTLEKNKVFIK